MSDPELRWHCPACGDDEPLDPADVAEHGDKEKCVVCYAGFSQVMTLKEAAKLEQRRALGLHPPSVFDTRPPRHNDTQRRTNEGGSRE